ncbi:MAG: hypothetical protein MJ153_00725 [Clostridia bacterium]|nr:hypothetical protein [Clostridia bacterium]
MKYFIANLSAHSLLMIFLLILLIIFSNRNRRRKNKWAFSYLIPVVLSVGIVIYISLIIAPRFCDITDVLSQNYQSYTGTLEKKSFFNNYIIVDGTRYYYNPLHEIPNEGENVKVLYTHNSNFAMSVEYAPVVVMEENSEAEG